jgi:glycosyltransferase involved in cell wall biosynthesis
MSLGVRAYVYVYDVIPLTNPEWFEIDLASTFNEYIKSIATIKCGIIVSTHHVQMRIKNAFRDLENEVFVIGLAARETLTSNVAESTSKKDPRNEVSRSSKIKAIMVGTIEPRKGHMDVLRIFQDKRVSEKIELNVVGGPGWKAEAIEVALRESSHTGAINFLGRISDKELSLLYANSDVLIAASYDEGFGLPLVEAAGLGLAVVARDIPVFREVSDSNTHFLDLSNVESARDYLLSEDFEKLITTVKIGVEASEARRRWSNVVEDLFNKFEK